MYHLVYAQLLAIRRRLVEKILDTPNSQTVVKSPGLLAGFKLL